MNPVQEYFNARAKHYNLDSEKFTWRWLRSQEWKCIEEILPKKSQKVLELGCGSGYYTGRLRKHFPNITAVDFSKNMLNQVAMSDITVIEGNIEELEFMDSFDLIFGAGILEFLKFPKATLLKYLELLPPEGRAIFLVPRKSVAGLAYSYFHRLHHIHVHLFDESFFLTPNTRVESKVITPFGLLTTVFKQ